MTQLTLPLVPRREPSRQRPVLERSDLPEPLRMAVRLTAASLYENRGDGPDKAASAVSPAAIALIAPYRRVRL